MGNRASGIRSFTFAVGAVAVLVACCFAAAYGEETAGPPGKKNLYAGGDFDNWVWEPISYYAVPSLKAAKKAGYDLNCEIRGPLYQVPKGLAVYGVCGYMVEGPEAYKGKAARFVVTDPKNSFTTGQSPTSLATSKRHGCEFYVKGKGRVSLHVGLGGVKKPGGEAVWVECPDIFKVEATPQWTRYAGTFTFPKPPDDVVLNETADARIMVDPGSDLMIDELKVWEE